MELVTVVPIHTLEEPVSAYGMPITGTIPAPVMSSPLLFRRARCPMISVFTLSPIQHSRCLTSYRPASHRSRINSHREIHAIRHFAVHDRSGVGRSYI